MSGSGQIRVAAPDFSGAGTERLTGSGQVRVAAPDFTGSGTFDTSASGSCQIRVAAADLSGSGTAGAVTVYATTKERVKLYAGGFADTTSDAVIDIFIASVSREIERHIGYPLALAEYVEVYDIDGAFVHLRTLPVVSVDLVTYSATYDFANGAELAESTDYRVSLGMVGELVLRGQRTGGLQITYTAGLGVSTAAVIAAAPVLAHAADLQVIEELKRRNTGSQGRAHGLLGRSRQLLSSYRRMTMDSIDN